VRCSQPLTIAFVDLEVSPFLHGSGDHFENRKRPANPS
jgi:hypothetical protein